MKKILIIGMSHNPGGVESFLINYVSRFNKQKVHFDFLVFSNTCYYEDYLRSNNSKVFYIASSQFKQFFRFNKEVEEILKKEHYDAIWMNVCDLANARVLSIAKKVGIKKRIVHAHNNKSMHTGKKAFFYSLMHEKYKKRISCIATNFWACSNEAAEYFYPENVRKSNTFEIIYNSIDTQKYRFNAKKREIMREKLNLNEKIVIGNVGRLQYQKNQEFLIKIINELKKINNNYHLLLIGQGEEKENLVNQINNLHLNEYITFTGAISNVEDYYNAMDLFVLPSRFEGLGIVLIEAQAAGLKCFTSKDVVPQDANVTGSVEYISLSKSPEYWAQQIEKYKNNENRLLVNDLVKKSNYDIESQVLYVEKLLLED